MILANISKLFDVQLQVLEKEVSAFDEKFLWAVAPGISNSAGNLALHLLGNLNTYIGAVLGKTSYIRNREDEFSLKNLPAAQLISMIAETRKMISQVLENVSESSLQEDYPVLVFENPQTTGYFLLHLCSHLSYHNGQINYLRRILEA
ncbi:MAG: DinB family protein [Daejeonella sp.]